jgi:hypothetical protein
MGKRSFINTDRLALLKSEDAVYVITCHQAEYYCKDHGQGRCSRGFFSLFLQAVYGIEFALKMNIACYVDFGNLRYSYSEGDKFHGNENFWEYYFEQTPMNPNGKVVYNSRFENFPLKIWDRSLLRQLHQTFISNFTLKQGIKELVASVKTYFHNKTILGIHIRKTDHFHEIKPAKEADYLKLIDQQLPDFDRLFLATDDTQVLQLFEKKYGDKLFYHAFTRSSGDKPIHDQSEDPNNGYELGKEALLDCYSLSFCSKAILSPSNLSYCALILNPELPYLMAESDAAKWQRFKTLGLYYLNKWGIRKW